MRRGKHFIYQLTFGTIFCVLVILGGNGRQIQKLSWAAPNDTLNWQTTCVDCPPNFNSLTAHAMRLDAGGNPHVALGNDRLYYAWRNGAGWQYEVVDPDRSTGSNASLALDSQGMPHISYRDSHNKHLKYAYKTATGWQTETVDAEVWTGSHTSLVLDANDWPHISYEDYNENADDLVRYAYWNGMQWHIQIIGVGNGPTSLVLDENGRPHVTYRQVWEVGGIISQVAFKYAYWSGTVWQVEAIATGSNLNNGYGDLTLGVDDIPHVVYSSGDQNNLYYAYRDTGDWQIEEIAGMASYYNPTLALDTLGKVHVVYTYMRYVGNNYEFGVVHTHQQQTGGWQMEDLRAAQSSTQFYRPSIALDDQDALHVEYQEFPVEYTSDIVYMLKEQDAWQTEAVMREGYVGIGNDLALDATGYPHISYIDLDNSAVKYAYQDISGWHLQTVVPSASVFADNRTAIALDNTGRVHLAYDDGNVLRYAALVDGTWSFEIVDAWYLYNSGPSGISMVLDSNDEPHLCYRFLKLIEYSEYIKDIKTVRYAYHDSGGWHVEDVMDSNALSNPCILQLDAFDQPHLVFQHEEHIVHAQPNAGAWAVETIDPEPGTAEFASLALDSTGKPHVGYRYETLSGISYWHVRYAHRNGNTWLIETIDSSDHVGSYVQIALDQNDRVHLVYKDSTQNVFDIKYVRQTTDGWQYMVALSDGDVGDHLALALDRQNRPHIAFYDSFGQHELVYGFVPDYGVQLQTDNFYQEGNAGEVVESLVVLNNAGNSEDSFSISLSGNQWSVMAETKTEAVERNGAVTIPIRVHIPVGVIDDNIDTVTVTFRSEHDNSKTAVATITTVRHIERFFLPLICR